MSAVTDKYCKPTILAGGVLEETVYRNCLNYAKIVFSDELEYNILYQDVRRAKIHDSIAKYCDCDKDLVSESLSGAFLNKGLHYPHPVDDRFLKCVDNWFDRLKEIAQLPEKERFPTSIFDDVEMPDDLAMPNTAVEVKNDYDTRGSQRHR